MATLMKEFLTTDEVAEKLGTTRTTVIALINRGELAATRVGKLWKITEVDLIDFVNRNYKGYTPKEKPEEK